MKHLQAKEVLDIADPSKSPPTTDPSKPSSTAGEEDLSYLSLLSGQFVDELLKDYTADKGAVQGVCDTPLCW